MQFTNIYEPHQGKKHISSSSVDNTAPDLPTHDANMEVDLDRQCPHLMIKPALVGIVHMY